MDKNMRKAVEKKSFLEGLVDSAKSALTNSNVKKLKKQGNDRYGRKLKEKK